MAIFPLHNKHVVNVPVAISTDFKAGSALMYDNNGRAVLADRASFSFDSLDEQRSKFIKPFYGSDEIISGLSRYCIWINDKVLSQLFCGSCIQ